MDNELMGTAWHEAGHAIALKRLGVGVTKVEVTTAASGKTEFEHNTFDKLTPENKAHVALVGIYSESLIRDEYSVEEALSMLAGASSDRNFLYQKFAPWWIAQGTLGRQVTHNKAQKFAQDNKVDIERLAGVLLAKVDFPKVLTGAEFEAALK